jgi:hypothetical protein
MKLFCFTPLSIKQLRQLLKLVKKPCQTGSFMFTRRSPQLVIMQTDNVPTRSGHYCVGSDSLKLGLSFAGRFKQLFFFCDSLKLGPTVFFFVTLMFQLDGSLELVQEHYWGWMHPCSLVGSQNWFAPGFA